MRCQKFGYKRDRSWLGIGLAKFGRLAYFSCLCSKIGEKVKSWFWRNLSGELSQIHPKWGVKSLVAKGIDLVWVLAYPSLVAWPSFCALVAKLVKNWSHGFWAILMGKCHKGIQNEVSKVWLQKESILVGFRLSQVGWIGFLCHGSKIGIKVKSLFLSNLGWQLSQIHAKWGVNSLVAKGIDLGLVLALPSLVAWPSFCALVSKFVKKWRHSFWAILLGNCHKCIQNEVSKVWLQRELILVGFWLIYVWSLGLVFVPS